MYDHRVVRDPRAPKALQPQADSSLWQDCLRQLAAHIPTSSILGLTGWSSHYYGPFLGILCTQLLFSNDFFPGYQISCGAPLALISGV